MRGDTPFCAPRGRDVEHRSNWPLSALGVQGATSKPDLKSNWPLPTYKGGHLPKIGVPYRVTNPCDIHVVAPMGDDARRGQVEAIQCARSSGAVIAAETAAIEIRDWEEGSSRFQGSDFGL